jgi:ribosomal protein S18 acetylase RimI-like enzyme
MTRANKVEITIVVVPDEIQALCDFDRKVFGSYPDDLFSAEDWAELESYWVTADGVIAGCTALRQNVDYTEDPKPGSLYVESTGILPTWQGQGLGTRVKAWQLEYARRNGFRTIVTNARESNVASVRLNQKFGFGIREIVPNYYSSPAESAIVLELLITVP